MKHPIVKRKPNRRDDPLYGLNRRVARKLGKSESLISVVRRGIVASAKVADAIEQEAQAMIREWAQARRAAGACGRTARWRTAFCARSPPVLIFRRSCRIQCGRATG